LPLLGVAAAALGQQAPPAEGFDFASVEGLARGLAAEPYAPDQGGLPDYLAEINYDQYRDIRFRPEHALWFAEGLPFRAQFFHRGFLYKDRVRVYTIAAGKAEPVPYAAGQFDYGANTFPSPPADIGYAGLRLLYPLRRDGRFDEIATFLGASYFRGIGIGQGYGISARGLAVDTGLPKAEEFPVFKAFWIEKPGPGATGLTAYGLMDGPSVAGAYRFVLHPGQDLVVEVKCHLYLRQAVGRFGIAPLTSMFFHGENTDRFMDDFRPEVHDSDGLLFQTRQGERVWRPLQNPLRLAVSVFAGDDIRGYGLMQRDREFDHYQDLEAVYHLRPSAWVEPVGDWGPGSVYLIEIPSDAEKYDNIVAFWVPKRATAPGQDWVFDYKLHFTLDDPEQDRSGGTVATRVGAAGTAVLVRERRKFVVDFASATLAAMGSEAPIQALVTASSGQAGMPVVHKNLSSGEWRMAFEYEPAAGTDPVDLRAFLRLGSEVLTETWIYQWSQSP
jgi:glucans biosynthesis protein